MRLIKRVLVTTILVSVLTSIITARGSTAYLVTVKGLWDGSDIVVLGTVTEITRHREEGDLIHFIVKLDVEKYYKNPIDYETLNVRVEEQPAEEADFEKINERVLLFLRLTNQILKNEPVFSVYFSDQGKYKVNKENIAKRWMSPSLKLTEDSINWSMGRTVLIQETKNVTEAINMLIEVHKKRTILDPIFLTSFGVGVAGIILLYIRALIKVRKQPP